MPTIDEINAQIRTRLQDEHTPYAVPTFSLESEPLTPPKPKKSKNTLRKDTVTSDTIHVGIELELIAEGSESDAEHDDEECENSYREMIEGDGAAELLQNHFSISSGTARRLVENDIVSEEAIVNYVCQGWTCDDSECGHWSRGESPESKREDILGEIRGVSGNSSVKVMGDSSIEKEDGEIDAEVCWNYFISKETLQDNHKILAKLKELECKFNTSCGLHINLNNYLKVPAVNIPTDKLDFLFYFVGPSRRRSSYCTARGMGSEKYSMIYNQGDRLEFRFFSPTLESVKLNHYVTLAHTVYKRLAGIDAKLPKRSADYFLKKMTTLNKLDSTIAEYAITCVNKIKSAEQYREENSISFLVDEEAEV